MDQIGGRVSARDAVLIGPKTGIRFGTVVAHPGVRWREAKRRMAARNVRDEMTFLTCHCWGRSRARVEAIITGHSLD